MATQLSDRIRAAMLRSGLTYDRKSFELPTFTRAQVEALEAIYPVRLLSPGEDVDAFRHYCGAAALVQLLKDHCPDITTETSVSGEDDEDLDLEAVGRAIAQHNGTTYEG